MTDDKTTNNKFQVLTGLVVAYLISHHKWLAVADWLVSGHLKVSFLQYLEIYKIVALVCLHFCPFCVSGTNLMYRMLAYYYVQWSNLIT
ncbi:hypothetical protein D0Y65_038468 [Glycine soja]|uniref:Uncharacterized protein n=1 Tax=Glycine soja TaxID=3848 RepID=A0A445H546_GLYSO|nr:hypothetical protein D0Y65_038468 [Glycine soja]